MPSWDEKLRRDFTTFYNIFTSLCKEKCWGVLRRTKQGHRIKSTIRICAGEKSLKHPFVRNYGVNDHLPSALLWCGNSKCHQHNLILARERTSASRRRKHEAKKRDENLSFSSIRVNPKWVVKRVTVETRRNTPLWWWSTFSYSSSLFAHIII